VSRNKFKPGDLVRVLPEFLDEEGEQDVGVIMGLLHPELEHLLRGGLQWWIVLRGEKLVHHPEDTISPVRDEQ
jgi:hypothetical protein